MPSAPLHPQEDLRLSILQDLDLVRGVLGNEFDIYTKMATKLTGMPMAAVALIDRSRVWFKSAAGFSPADLMIPSIPREHSICQYTILRPGEVLAIGDARSDPRICDMPMVTQRDGIRAYAGIAFNGPKGMPLGTICVTDRTAREFDADELEQMTSLAKAIEAVMANHTARHETRQQKSWTARPSSVARRATALPLIAERGLDAAGIVLGIVSNPEQGNEATFEYANDSFAELMGTTVDEMKGRRFGSMLERIGDLPARNTLMRAMRLLESARIDIPLKTAEGDRWLGANVTFPEPEATGARRMLVIGRDITKTMSNLSREEKSKMLMTSMFTQVDVPVVLVGKTGRIAMANTAFRAMVELTPDQIDGRSFYEFVLPEHMVATRIEADRQIQDGTTYRRNLPMRSATGKVTEVQLTSALLAFEGQPYRILTLNPASPSASGAIMTGEFRMSAERAAGEFRPLSLTAMRSAFGKGWPKIALAAMLVAERTARRRLQAEDVITRLDDDTFAIWFDGINRTKNDDVLELINKDVRIQLMVQFSKEIAANGEAV